MRGCSIRLADTVVAGGGTGHARPSVDPTVTTVWLELSRAYRVTAALRELAPWLAHKPRPSHSSWLTLRESGRGLMRHPARPTPSSE
jgi:hypothetical protein